MNMVKFLVMDKVIICIVIESILVNLIVLIVFHLLFLWIKKVSVFIMIFYMMDMVICVFKADRVFFWNMARNYFRSRSCVSGFIFIFVKFIWPQSMFVIVPNQLFYGCL